MADYISTSITFSPEEEFIADLIADSLAEIGYEMFEPDSGSLVAYIPSAIYSEEKLNLALNEINEIESHSFQSEFIKGQDWNAEWEKNYFQPIVIGNQCVVHSTFHTDVPKAYYDIVIDPKMAFGTGHHSTTMLMMQYLLDNDIVDKSLIDMGTGTGILSILASMRGAKPVTGIEIDPDAYYNAVDNANLNKADITLINGDASSLSSVAPANLFFANINRNIILNDLHLYFKSLLPNGELFLSGFYLEDVEMIASEAQKYGLSLTEVKSDNNWAAIKFRFISAKMD